LRPSRCEARVRPALQPRRPSRTEGLPVALPLQPMYPPPRSLAPPSRWPSPFRPPARLPRPQARSPASCLPCAWAAAPPSRSSRPGGASSRPAWPPSTLRAACWHSVCSWEPWVSFSIKGAGWAAGACAPPPEAPRAPSPPRPPSNQARPRPSPEAGALPAMWYANSVWFPTFRLTVPSTCVMMAITVAQARGRAAGPSCRAAVGGGKALRPWSPGHILQRRGETPPPLGGLAAQQSGAARLMPAALPTPRACLSGQSTAPPQRPPSCPFPPPTCRASGD
jgi:hypothetical protein